MTCRGMLIFLAVLAPFPALAQWSMGDAEAVLGELLEAPAESFVEQSVELTQAEFQKLLEGEQGQPISLPSLNLGLTKSDPLVLRRVSIYRADARLVIFRDGDRIRFAPSGRLFYRGISASGGLSLALDLKSGEARGYFAQGDSAYNVVGTPAKGGGLELSLLNHSQFAAQRQFFCEMDKREQPPEALRTLTQQGFPSKRLAAPAGTPTYQATIAVDTDNELLFNKFNNNSSAAQSYIEDLVAAMNIIYERDLSMNLVLGTVFLRIDTTPAGSPDFNEDPEGFNDSLGAFSNYWMNNHTDVQRQFAMLLSGNIGCTNCVSGVAWVNQYCENTLDFPGDISGSFSFNRIGPGSLIDAQFASGVIGHEIGHNLGSLHTHCEMLASGGTDFVDHCYNECGSFNQNGDCTQLDPDCYQGSTECPAGGVGSLMSYCHAPPSGFDGTGLEVGPPDPCDNSDVFDPLIIGKLDNLIAANNPSCIADFGGANAAPVAQDDSYTVTEGMTLSVSAPGVLDNDTDADMDMLTAQLVSGPSSAQAFTLNNDGSFAYTPNGGFTGSDSFSYQADDGSDSSNTATVTIMVEPLGLVFKDGFEDAP